MKVNYNKCKNILTVKGSLAYFIQGHNFWFDIKGVEKAINRMSKVSKRERVKNTLWKK